MSNDAKTKEKVRIAVFFSLCILLVVGIFVSIGSGTVSLSVSETWAALLGEADADTDRIVNLIRLPRTIVTVLVGANLALAGCNLQGVLHNPLADHGIIGVSAGAGLFAMVIMLLFPEQSAMVPLAAFVGAVLSTGIVFFLAWEKGINPLRMILAGVAVATFFGGGMAALNVFYSDRIQGTVMWMAGGFQGRSWGHVEMLLPYSAIGIIGTILCARSLNALQLGDELAKSLGVRVMRMRTILIFLSALLAAVSVSVAGMLGFVGLIVPTSMVCAVICKTRSRLSLWPLSREASAVITASAWRKPTSCWCAICRRRTQRRRQTCITSLAPLRGATAWQATSGR